MSDGYKEYLAARVLSESRPATYRLLSRALKVNVNTAKCMLYEFYTKQIATKPKSLHATYLLTGKKRRTEQPKGVNGRDGEDTFMHSSPYMSSLPEPEDPVEEPVPTTSIVLVREEELEQTKSEFEEITSIHIYSLEPGPIENMNMLSVCNQEIAKDFSSEDPLERWKAYGSIHNPHIKRRTMKYTPPAAAASNVSSKAVGKPAAAAPATKDKDAPASAQRGNGSEPNTSGRSTPQSTPAGSTLKRSDSQSRLKREKSNLFKSFAKAKPKQKEAEKSKESTPAPLEDEPMKGMSEDEGDDEEGPEIKKDPEKEAQARKERAEREEKLRKMMEDDDAEMLDAPDVDEEESHDAPVDKSLQNKPTGSETAVTVEGGRRRGRRKVMKKKTVKDEEGYLVTKEEAVWESFSEDEPEPKKLKPAPAKTTTTTKGKKTGTGKHGQGSIANFFKKA